MKNTKSESKAHKNSSEIFYNELKIHINKKLFEKHIISEEMYRAVNELLIRQAV